jgi:surfeit locus 1 family protein
VDNRAAAAPRRRGLLVPALLAALGCAILASLGTWQLERKAWKESLIDTLGRRLAAPPTAVPPPSQWASLDAGNAEFRHVRFAADLEPGQEALVFTSGSAFRRDVSGPGYWLFAPARLADGSRVVVNRGFVPEARRDPAARLRVTGPVEIVGVMRWPERGGLFTPAGDPAHDLWFVRDHLEIAAAKNWGVVAPFYVEQEAPIPPGGLPQPGMLTIDLPNNHLQYAITWFGLAAGLATVFMFYARAQWRERHPPAGPGTGPSLP